MEPTFAGLFFMFAAIGIYSSSVAVFRPAPASAATVRRASTASHVLMVDITGHGRWVEQARGPAADLRKLAAQIRKRECMNTRIDPL